MYEKDNGIKSNISVSDKLAERAAQVQRGGARAAVLGVNDGLVSTLLIVVGVAATNTDIKMVLLAGLAGALAGAISMAAGEWISMKAQVELFEGVLEDLKEADKKDHALLTKNLSANFQEHGMEVTTATQAATDVAKREEKFLSMYSSQIIGVNRDELGSPWIAAFSSFALFATGAAAPLLPWIIGMETIPGIVASVVLTGIGGLLVGAYTAKTSGKSLSVGALRQLIIIIFAASITYLIGLLFGVSVA